jgi:hypothetical protein
VLFVSVPCLEKKRPHIFFSFLLPLFKALLSLFHGSCYALVNVDKKWVGPLFERFFTNWGRCYDHNFLRLSRFFFKKQCYDSNSAKSRSMLNKNAKFFGENI